MIHSKHLGIGFLIIILSSIGFLYSGLFPMGADNKHNAFTFWVLETLRTKSIARAASNIEVPPLNSPQLLLSGGADYNDMCSGCHLKPGQEDNDMALGLYPAPPNLTVSSDKHGHAHEDDSHNDIDATAKQQFWVIKHGIMASGMAAFGPTHDDERIWAMVAFIKRLPTLTPEQYQIITARQ
ncbi:MAG: cytochrome c [Moritella sp.]|uniref:c-type cytochrome n=1 Tax=Moritella sp. TaxID=78556 RepID=UPI001DE3F862|nr:cytochrome c [Moritella sp.]NQZ50892.1 cytochrome c [Moritella sp.]NRA19124.1 cytochrome c [Oceanospirillaceae bacterium]NRB42106.1 cytochrome c [Pseudomonadales bacterium]